MTYHSFCTLKIRSSMFIASVTKYMPLRMGEGGADEGGGEDGGGGRGRGRGGEDGGEEQCMHRDTRGDDMSTHHSPVSV